MEELMLTPSVLIFCGTCISLLHMHLQFKREERKHVAGYEIASKLQEELDKIDELKAKVDTLALKVGLNTTVKYTGNTRG